VRFVSTQESAGCRDHKIESAVTPASAATPTSVVPPYNGASVPATKRDAATSSPTPRMTAISTSVEDPSCSPPLPTKAIAASEPATATMIARPASQRSLRATTRGPLRTALTSRVLAAEA
jgi:hypothetical protein